MRQWVYVGVSFALLVLGLGTAEAVGQRNAVSDETASRLHGGAATYNCIFMANSPKTYCCDCNSPVNTDQPDIGGYYEVTQRACADGKTCQYPFYASCGS